MIRIIALIMGRFQPMHNGHVKAIKKMFAENEKVIIGIGSSQYHHTSDNPYTSDERMRMIKSVFPKLEVSTITDIHDHSQWCKHVRQTFKFDVIYSGSGVNYDLLCKEFEIKKLPRYEGINATDIRRRIVSGEKWEHLVPRPVVKIMKELGLDRIVI